MVPSVRLVINYFESQTGQNKLLQFQYLLGLLPGSTAVDEPAKRKRVAVTTEALADACARSRSRNTLRHSKRRAPQGRQWRTKWRRGCAVRSAGDDAAAKRRPITARCRSRARAGTMSSWRAAWNSRSAPNEATPSWIRALDIVSETALCWSSFDCTPRGARSDRRLLPLEIKRRHLLRKAQLATGHL